VNTSDVNVDQSVSCNADGSFVLSQFKSTDGSCSGSRYPDRIQLLYGKGQCIADTAGGSYRSATVICPVPAGKAEIVLTETSAPSAYKTCLDDTEKSSFQVDQGACYGLAGVNTSDVNVDQSVSCNADGSFVLSQFKSTDGSCSGSRYPDRIQLLYGKGQCIANTGAGSYQSASVKCPEAPTQNIVKLAESVKDLSALVSAPPSSILV